MSLRSQGCSWAAIVFGLTLASHCLPRPAMASDAAASPCTDSSCHPLRLQVKMAATRQPLEQAKIYVFPAPAQARPRRLRAPVTPPAEGAWILQAESDVHGHVELPAVPAGRAYVVVIAPGVGRLDMLIDVAPRKDRLKLFVPEDEASRYRTVVRPPPQDHGHVTSSVMSEEEIQSVPGSQGDPLRALQNMPGVARVPGHLGLLVLRGAPPQQSRIFAGGHALPRAFHLLSMSSVFPTDIIESLRMVPGNFDAAYGNATGGIVLVDLRDGRRTGVHGHGELDIAAASALIEGPAGPGSFIVAGSRGYMDAALDVADRVTERITGERSSFLLPSYYDYQGRLSFPLGRFAVFGVRAFGSGDRVHSARRNEGGASFDFHNAFHRIDLDYRVRRPRHWVWLTPSFRFEENRYEASFIESANLRRRDYVFSYRGEFGTQLTSRLTLTVGFDGEVARLRIPSGTPSSPPPDGSSPSSSSNTTETTLATWGRLEARLGRWHVTSGLRANAFSVSRKFAFSVDPRLSAHLDLSPTWRIHAGIGRYSQVRASYDSGLFLLTHHALPLGFQDALPQLFQDFNPTLQFSPRNAEVGVRQAWHGSAGARVRWGAGYSAEATAFWRSQDDDTPVYGTMGATLVGAAHIDTLGLELLLRKALTRRLYGWVAYTLMWSRVRIADSNPAIDPYPSDYDQRHNLVVLLSYKLPRGVRLGASWRFSTGYPYSPIIGALQTDFGAFAIHGDYNSARLGAFHQLDVRVDKEWITRRTRVRVYVDVRNATNRVNPEWVHYRPDLRGIDFVVGMPIFPTLGIRVDF